MDEATENEHSPELIDGTFCTDCYLVFAKIEGFKIGIKPLFQPEHSASFVGFRVRAVATDVDIAKGDDIVAAFPGFNFGKWDSSRASLMGGIYINRTKYQGNEIIAFIKSNRVVGKTMTVLKEHLGDIPMVGEEYLYSWFGDKLVEVVKDKCHVMEIQNELPAVECTVIHMDKYKAAAALGGEAVEESENQM